jgi:hypothetical protein
LLRAEDGDLVVPAPVSAEVDYLIRRRGSALADLSVVILAHRFRTRRLLTLATVPTRPRV